jgi:hypothetical protein
MNMAVSARQLSPGPANAQPYPPKMTGGMLRISEEQLLMTLTEAIVIDNGEGEHLIRPAAVPGGLKAVAGVRPHTARRADLVQTPAARY